MRRRDFIRRALCATAGSAAFGSVFGKLGIAHAASHGLRLKGAGSDYRALVCIYLDGGNDCFNTIVPRGAGHAEYAATRGSLAVPEGQLLPITPVVAPEGGGLWGLHPSMPGLQSMFDDGLASIVANVGPLVRPVDRALYQQQGTPLPAQLFSHSDQSVLWQTPRADALDRTGWGGRLADIFHADNANPVLSMNVSMDGDNVFQSGQAVSPYFMSSYGVEEIGQIQTGAGVTDCNGPNTWNRRRCLSFNALLQAPLGHPFERAYAGKLESTVETTAQVAAAIALFPPDDAVFRPFWDAFGLPWNPGDLAELPRLAAQLLMVARMIRARDVLQMSRQLFFARLGGFDTHDRQLDDHPALLHDLSQSLLAFYQVLDSPAFGLSDQVTSFTASEFGRTLTNNGDGTDHGWGGHHVVVGGSVVGGRIFGRMPSLAASDSNPDDAGWGQVIPTLSVDQYAATLATWYGVGSSERALIFPNLGFMEGPLLSIEGPDLGFMAPA